MKLLYLGGGELGHLHRLGVLALGLGEHVDSVLGALRVGPEIDGVIAAHAAPLRLLEELGVADVAGDDGPPREPHIYRRAISPGDASMAYSAEISRSNPSCFLFLIDQSGSMQDAVDAALGNWRVD